MSSPVPRKTRRRLAALFSVPLAFSLVFFFVNEAADRREAHLLQAEKLSGCLTQLRAHARDAESGERGYYLTGEDRYLTPLLQTQGTLGGWIRQARAESRLQPRYGPRVEHVIKLVQLRFARAFKGVALRRRGVLSSAEFATQIEQSQDTMDEIRREVRALLNELDREELAILNAQHAFSKWSFVFFSAGSLLMIGIIFWLYKVLLKYLHERDAVTEELKATNTHLETRIKERTLDLTQANEELQQFAYVASHDLQEPLRTITSFSQLLAMRYQGRLDADADEFIGYIISSSRRMTDLINGLLALVRLRKSGQPTAQVPFAGLLGEAEIGLQALIRETNTSIEHGPLPALVVDAVQFSQVLQNLLSNAIKYRRDVTPRICVEALKEASNWVFSVQDNGRGFNPEFAERIFGLFQRLHGREVEGTGMGLSISRKIVERHGGRMWAKSEEGVGSTFYFSLPVSLEVARDAAQAEMPDAVPQVR